MIRLLLFFIGLICLYPIQAQDKQMCITVDDLPVVPYGVKEVGHEQRITEGILSAFSNHQIPAIGYVNAGKLFSNGKVDSSRVKLLERWLQGGHELGNHTYAHVDYNQVSLERYAANIKAGERIIVALSFGYNQEIRFFRHPYLHTGSDSIKSAALDEYLNNEGYTVAPVTIDNDEYLFAKAFARAYLKKDPTQMEKIGAAYINYMCAKVIYFEKQSMRLFGRPIKQTLLIHANFLNAMYLEALITRFESMDYTFISQQEVLADAAYQTPVTAFGKWGISWIDRWALSQGKKGDFFSEEPQTPAFILDLTR